MAWYKPTAEERDVLAQKGWESYDDWWWPAGEGGFGRTYHQAMDEQQRRDRMRRVSPCAGHDREDVDQDGGDACGLPNPRAQRLDD